MNVACAGGEPLALTDCLNFGNPEKPGDRLGARAGDRGDLARRRVARHPGRFRERLALQRDRRRADPADAVRRLRRPRARRAPGSPTAGTRRPRVPAARLRARARRVRLAPCAPLLARARRLRRRRRARPARKRRVVAGRRRADAASKRAKASIVAVAPARDRLGTTSSSSGGSARCAACSDCVRPSRDVARLTYFGLYALQHRGQESAGIAVCEDGRLTAVRDLGLVPQVFDERSLSALRGEYAIGHTRYSTTGEQRAGRTRSRCSTTAACARSRSATTATSSTQTALRARRRQVARFELGLRGDRAH